LVARPAAERRYPLRNIGAGPSADKAAKACGYPRSCFNKRQTGRRRSVWRRATVAITVRRRSPGIAGSGLAPRHGAPEDTPDICGENDGGAPWEREE
jgi:hypothetical protein